MKIYNFPTNYGRRNETAREFYEHGSGALKRYHYSTDSVEISAEARARYEATRVIEMERARIRKIAREYEPVVSHIIRKMDDDGTAARAARIAELQRSYGEENTVFSDDILRAVAKRLI